MSLLKSSAGLLAALSCLSSSLVSAADSAPAPVPATQKPQAAVDGTSGLTADQIFDILAAELAGRRGNLATAFSYYLQAAELTQNAQLAELAVRAAISTDDDAAAERGMSLWLKLAPDSATAHQLAAYLRIRANDRVGALIHLQKLVEIESVEPGDAFAQAASIISRTPNVKFRLELMRSLVDLYPDSADAQQSLAMVAASVAHYETATTAARKALELRPEWNKPRLFLVKLLVSQGKREEGRALLEKYVSEDPDNETLRILYGQFLVDEKDFTTARDVFKGLLSKEPRQPDVLFAVGVLSLQLDDPEAAKTYFTRLYETGSRRDEAAFYLGQAEERTGHPQEAIKWYSEVQDDNGNSAQVRIANLKAEAGDIKGAREILQRLRDDSPDDAIALYLVEAQILDEVGRPVEEVLAVYAAALQAYPGESNLLYARALYAADHDRLPLAEKDLKEIIAADPDHADALNALGYTLADRTDRYQEALGYIERAYKLKPDEPAILDSMGWVNYHLGHYDEALKYLQRALNEMSDGEIAAHLGEVLWAMDEHSEAWKVWEDALRKHPDHAYLLKVIDRHRLSQGETDQDTTSATTTESRD